MIRKLQFNIKKLNILIDPLLLFVLPLMLLIGYFKEYFAVYLCILLHEFGHVAAASLFGRKVFLIKLLPVGLNVIIEEDTCNTWKRIATYFAGPVVNMFLSAFCFILKPFNLFNSETMYFFIYINIYLAAFNLIPVLPLDGGRILKNLLAGRVGWVLAGRYIKKISLLLSITFIVLGILQFYESMHNFSLILVGVYISFSIRSDEMEAAFMNIKYVIYRRSRLLKKGVYPARDLVVIKTIHLGEILKSMDFDRFHIIHVLDNELKLLRVFTEQEVIDGMLKYNTDITFEEFIEKCT